MHDALHVDADVRLLEALDLPPATVAVGKEREGVPCDLLENGVVVVAGERHRAYKIGPSRS
jgi:hypothetical protein